MPLAKNIRVTPEFRDQLRDFAWRRQASMSVVVGEAITEYAKGEFDMPEKVVEVDLLVSVKYNEPELYQQALERAHSEGLSLQEVVRYRLAVKMAEKGKG